MHWAYEGRKPKSTNLLTSSNAYPLHRNQEAFENRHSGVFIYPDALIDRSDWKRLAITRFTSMRAVRGTVVSTRPISISKASAILSRFAASDNGARSDVAAFLRRASAAFDDLAHFHREIRAGCKRRPSPEHDKLLTVEEGEEWKQKNKKGKKASWNELAASDGGILRTRTDGDIRGDTNLADRNLNPQRGEAELGSDGKKKERKRRNANDEGKREFATEMEANVVEKGTYYEGAAELQEDRKRRKEKKKKKKMVTDGQTAIFDSKGEKIPGAVEERHCREQQKLHDKYKVEREEEAAVELVDQKQRKHLEVGENLERLKDQKKKHEKKRKKNKGRED